MERRTSSGVAQGPRSVSRTMHVASALTQPIGSVQDIDCIGDDLKEVHLTAWEIDPAKIVELAADRGPFVDQSQSMSLYFPNPSLDDSVSRNGVAESGTAAPY